MTSDAFQAKALRSGVKRPLAFFIGRARLGMWESLAIRLPWVQESAGSNPAIPTGPHLTEGAEAMSWNKRTTARSPEEWGSWCNGSTSAF